VSTQRKTGIFISPEGAPAEDDYSQLLTGDPEEDRGRIAILLKTISQVNSDHEIETVVRNVVDRSIEVTRAERAILMLFDDDNVLRIRVARDKAGADLGTNLLYSQSVALRVAREGKGICLIDTANQGEIALGQSILDLRLLTVMCVPLRVKDRMTGVLYVDSKASTREFADRDLTLFRALASQVAAAIDNARLLQHYVDKQRIQQGLEVARDIQRSLLPRGGLQLDGLDIHGLYEACEETSGDYFDYIRRSGGRLGLVVGDVSGHGVGAALVMSTARALLRAFAATTAPPAELVTRLNRFLSDDIETGRFMTLFYGEVALEERQLTYVRAGHNEPLLYRAARDGFDELDVGGIALGVIDDFKFESAGPVSLDPGDVLLLYTDGIVEARNGAGEVFGQSRLEGVVRQTRAGSALQVAEAVRRAAVDFAGSGVKDDDITLVVAKIK
jgi:serine phosphatase RsbU (regulator of sigma subunit)